MTTPTLLERLEALRDITTWATGGWDLEPHATGAISDIATKASAELRRLYALADKFAAQERNYADQAEAMTALRAAAQKTLETVDAYMEQDDVPTCLTAIRALEALRAVLGSHVPVQPMGDEA